MGKTKIEYCTIPSWPNYEVTENGDVRNANTKRPIQLRASKSGHLYFLPKRGRKCYAHRAVLEVFAGPCPTGQETRHLDGNPQNNYRGNLAWGTKIQQWEDDKRNGNLRAKPIKLDADKIKKIRAIEGIMASRKVGNKFGVSHTVVLRIWRRRLWAHVAE